MVKVAVELQRHDAPLHGYNRETEDHKIDFLIVHIEQKMYYYGPRKKIRFLVQSRVQNSKQAQR